MDTPDLLNLLANWPLEPLGTLALLTGGTNNQVWLVETENESFFVLRLTSGVTELARFYYEAALLRALSTRSLPFSLPHLLQARNGELFLLVEQDSIVATLTPFLPGEVPERNVMSATSVGVALAQLDVALATISETALPADGGATRFSYGDLFHCHPLVTDPLAAIGQLLEPEQAGPICEILVRSQRDWEELSMRKLPRQLLHRDCGPGNVLMEEERVTAILDFEFAGVDMRIFDLCVALSWWPVRLMGTGREWELIDTFGCAYTAHCPLTTEELLALPSTLRMRDATSLVYRVGRYLAGLETQKTLRERARHSLWREAWLTANAETLVQHAFSWSKERKGA